MTHEYLTMNMIIFIGGLSRAESEYNRASHFKIGVRHYTSYTLDLYY